MAYELGGIKKKKPWWELLLGSFGGGVGETDLRTSLSPGTEPMFLGGGPAAPGAQATPLGESPAAAPAAKTPGLFTREGVTYGEEAIGTPESEWTPLEPEEIARRRKGFETERQPTLLPDGVPAGGEPAKKATPWTRAEWAAWEGTRATRKKRRAGKSRTVLAEAQDYSSLPWKRTV